MQPIAWETSFHVCCAIATPDYRSSQVSARSGVAGKAAVCRLGESLAQEETFERWNDWSVAQFTAGQLVEAEPGFRYALELDPENQEVAGNLAFC